MADNKNDQSLFAPPDFLNLPQPAPVQDLFATPQTARPARQTASYTDQSIAKFGQPTLPTKKELAQQEQDRVVEQWRHNLNNMLLAPEWLNASYSKREQMYNTWLKGKWQDTIKNTQDADLKKRLGRLPAEIIQPALKQQKKIIDAEWGFSDVAKGVEATAKSMLSYFVDTVPAQDMSFLIQQIDAANKTGTVPEFGANGSGAIASALSSAGVSWDTIRKFAAESLKNAQARQKAAQKDVKALRDSQSLGRKNTELEMEESRKQGRTDAGGGLAGEALGEVYAYAKNPQAALYGGIESLPTVVPAIAATVAGGPAGTVLAGGILSAQDAGSQAIAKIDQKTQAELDALPAYQAMIKGGMSHEDAVFQLGLRAAEAATPDAFAAGIITAPFSAGTGAGNAIAGNLVKQGLSKGAAAKVTAATFAKEALSSGGQSAGATAAANIGVNRALGTNDDITKGVGTSFVQGVAAAAPLSAGNAVPAYLSARAGAPEATTGGYDPTVEAPDANGGGAGPAAPNGGAGPTAGANAQPQRPTAAATGQATAAMAALRPLLDQANAQRGTAFSTKEMNALLDAALDTIAAGAPQDKIKLALDNILRPIPDGLGVSLLSEAMDLRAAKRTADAERAARQAGQQQQAAPEQTTQQAQQTTEQTQNGTTEDFNAGDYTSAGTVDELARAFAETAAASADIAETVSGPAEQTAANAEVAGAGGAERNSATADGGNAAEANPVGADREQPAADSRPDNQQSAAAGETDSAGQREQSGSARASTADGQRTESAATGAAGDLPRVKSQVTYQPPNGKPMSGTVTRVNKANRTFSLRTDVGTEFTNLPIDRIQREQATAETLTPEGNNIQQLKANAAQLSTSGSDFAGSAVALQQALNDGNLVLADYLASYLNAQGLQQFGSPVDRAINAMAEEVASATEMRMEGAPGFSQILTPAGYDVETLRRHADTLPNVDTLYSGTAYRLSNLLDSVTSDNNAILTATAERDAMRAAVAETNAQIAAEQAATGILPDGVLSDEMELLNQQLLENQRNLAEAETELAAAQAELAESVGRLDAMAQELYLQGLSQFAPPAENTGRGAERVLFSWNNLSANEQATIAQDFVRQYSSLPSEYSTIRAFQEAAVQDALHEEAGTIPMFGSLGVLERMSEAGRNIIRKIARGLAIVLAALTINQMVPINDATAATGHGYVQSVRVSEQMSTAADTVNAWVQSSRDNAGKPYIIADKASGELHIVNAKGEVETTVPALYGKQTGDAVQVGQTPAGIFTIHHEAAPRSYGGDIQQFATAPGGEIYAIHRVLTTNPAQHRAARLASKDPAQHRISLGCINIPADVYNKYLSGNFDGKLYVLPDQQNLGEVFHGIQEQQAREDLMPEQPLPQNISDENSTAYQSSTVNQAREDVTGQDGTAAAVYAINSPDPAVADSDMAQVSNIPAESNDFMMAGLPLLGAMRARRRAKERGQGGQATDEDSITSQPDKKLSDPEYSRMLGSETTDVQADHRESNSTANKRTWTSVFQHAQRVAASTADTQTSLLEFLDKTIGRAIDQDPSVHTAYVLLRLQKGVQERLEKQLMTRHMQPLDDLAKREAARMSIRGDTMARYLGSWLNAQHIPEANRAIRAAIEEELQDAYLTGTPEQVAQAEDSLRAFDEAEAKQIAPDELKKRTTVWANGQIVKPGYGLAGGMTTQSAQRIMGQIENYVGNPETFVTLERLRKEAIDGMLDFRESNGTLTPEAVAELRNRFEHYVPLYVTDEANAGGGDIYMGTNAFNPAGDHVRRGSSRTADHAYISIRKQLFRAAAGVSSLPFKQSIHELYMTKRPEGLLRVTMGSPFMPREAREAKGLYYRDGEKVYKYYFSDPAVLDGVFRQHAEPNWTGAGMLRQYTSTVGQMYTVYRAVFPFINWSRDTMSRTVSAVSRNLVDKNGNKISAVRTALALKARLADPLAVVHLQGYLHGGLFADTPTVRAYERLKSLGGASSYSDLIRKSVTNYRSELSRKPGVDKLRSALERVYTSNDAFSMAPAVKQFMVFEELGMSPEQAAFAVRDDFDAGIKSRFHDQLSIFYPFVGASANSFKNIVGRLSTPRGAAVYGALVAVALAAYTTLAALSGQDENGDDWLDTVDLRELSNSIPVRVGDSVIKIPVPFEVPRLAWTMAAGMHRASRGVDSWGNAGKALLHAGLREIQPFGLDNVGNGNDSFIKDLIVSATPEAFRFVSEIGLNQNALGGRVHGDTQYGGRSSESGMSKTADVWKNLAANIFEYSGGYIDMYPETVRKTVMNFLPGSLAAFGAWSEQSSLYMAEGELSTRQELGPWGMALGLNSVWDNGNRYAVNTYYRNQSKVRDLLTEYGIPWGGENIGSGDAASAIYDRALEAGATPQEAELISQAKAAERELDKEKRQLSKAVKEYKAAGLDPESAAPDFAEFNQNRRAIMEQFNTDYRRNTN